MAVICSCDTGGGNTGVPSCFAIFDVTKRLIFVEYFKEDGTINGIDVENDLNSGVLDQAFLDGKLQNLDGNLRWYPTPELKNITDERADDINEEFEDTSQVFIQEGARTFNGLYVGADPEWIKKMKSWRCLEKGVFYVDKSGNLIGAEKVDGILYPVLLEKESLSIKLVKGTDTTKQKAQVIFQINQLEDDGDLKMISAAEITADLLGSTGLLDVQAEISGAPNAPTTTTFQATMKTCYGTAVNPILAEGLEAADFDVFNETGSAAVTLTSVTETSPGVYDFLYPAQTAGDVLRVSNKTTGTLDKGYDIETFRVTIPSS